MRLLLLLAALPFIGPLSACTAAQDESPSPVPDQIAQRPAVAASLDVLRDRAEYAALDEQSVETVARAAGSRWPEELAGFTYQRVERFSAGGVAHWMSIWSHGKTGLEFVLVPGGTFQMGSPVSEPGRREDERQHAVTLDPFLVARTECTREAWAKLASATDPNANPLEGTEQLPIAGIGPADVELWCREARLTFPTEAQWECMCRAGTTSAWTMGASKNDLVHFGNLGSAECPNDWIGMAGITEPWFDGYGDVTAPVGTFESNAFGLFDVHGNLNEWCRDFYWGYDTPAAAGTGLRPGDSGERQARGGSYGGAAAAARSAKRLTCGPGDTPGSGSNNGFGFRPSVDLPF